MIRFAILTASLVFATALEAKDDSNKADMEKMQGDWIAIQMTRDGEEVPEDDAQGLFRTVKGEEYSVFRFDRLAGKGTFKIDATKNPKTIDALPSNAKDKSKPMQGIYELEGN